jgi:hypothetical protein
MDAFADQVIDEIGQDLFLEAPFSSSGVTRYGKMPWNSLLPILSSFC